MITLGTTLRCNLPPRHIWVVLSDPQGTGGDILMVNMTSLTEECVDDLCVLGPEDFDLLTHATTIAYSRHRAGPVAGLQGLIVNGSFSVVKAVSRAVLQKILAGARQSPQLPAAKKALLG